MAILISSPNKCQHLVVRMVKSPDHDTCDRARTALGFAATSVTWRSTSSYPYGCIFSNHGSSVSLNTYNYYRQCGYNGMSCICKIQNPHMHMARRFSTSQYIRPMCMWYHKVFCQDGNDLHRSKQHLPHVFPLRVCRRG